MMTPEFLCIECQLIMPANFVETHFKAIHSDPIDEMMPPALHRRVQALEKEVVDLRQKLAGLGGV